MTNNDIITLFKQAVREVDQNSKLDDLTPSTEIANLGLDSVMTMEVIGVLEEKLNVRFPDEELATLKSVGDLTSLIQRMAA
jgi:acyl carrier protein